VTIVSVHLVDSNPAVVDAWRHCFAEFPEVHIERGNILDVAAGAVLSPANSFGFMDGGIDRAYAAFFGPTLTAAVRNAVLAQPEGHLPIGAAVAIPTGNPRISYLVVAPTMVSPEHAAPAVAYRAFRAALKLMARSPDLGNTLFAPGLATGVGLADPAAVASEMAEAYRDWKAG
jgi:O-acetyl-ADP-ribose deacetylase (regulator of RNase III)